MDRLWGSVCSQTLTEEDMGRVCRALNSSSDGEPVSILTLLIRSIN